MVLVRSLGLISNPLDTLPNIERSQDFGSMRIVLDVRGAVITVTKDANRVSLAQDLVHHGDIRFEGSTRSLPMQRILNLGWSG
jgi:hypothetical protein